MDLFQLAVDLARVHALEHQEEAQDADRPVFCIWCHIEHVDPEHYPYCSPACGCCAAAD